MLTDKKKEKIAEIAEKSGIMFSVYAAYDIKTIKADLKQTQAKERALEKILAIIAPPKKV